MTLPEPETGLVIRYAYLWHDESLRGREEGRKDRPCAVVLALKRKDGLIHVMVAPITHSPPRAEMRSIEIPAPVARRLGLDDQRCWIVTHEMNSIVSPGPDMRPVSNTRSQREFAFGFLPEDIAQKMIDAARENRRAGRLAITSRDLPPN